MMSAGTCTSFHRSLPIHELFCRLWKHYPSHTFPVGPSATARIVEMLSVSLCSPGVISYAWIGTIPCLEELSALLSWALQGCWSQTPLILPRRCVTRFLCIIPAEQTFLIPFIWEMTYCTSTDVQPLNFFSLFRLRLFAILWTRYST